MSRRGASVGGGVFTTILVGALILSVVAIIAAQIVTEGNNNYNLGANTSEYAVFDQVEQVNNLTSNMNSAFNTNSTTTGGTFANSFDTVFGLGLTLSRLSAAVPGIYAAIINGAAQQLGIADSSLLNVAVLVLIIIIITVFMALLLGKYL